MAVPFSNNKLRVPHGFQALLEGMAKEILFNQPPDIYAFSALYFENLLKIRAGGTPDPVDKYAQIEDRTNNNRAFQVSQNSSGLEEEQNAAVTIQTKYRQHSAKTTADELRQYNAAVKIQASVRGHITRKRMQTTKDDDQQERSDGEHMLPDEDEDIEFSDTQGLPADLPGASPEPLLDEPPVQVSAETLSAEDEPAESNEETEAATEIQPLVAEAETAVANTTQNVELLDQAEALEHENAKEAEDRPASGRNDEQEEITERADDEIENSEVMKSRRESAEGKVDDDKVDIEPADEADSEAEECDKPADDEMRRSAIDEDVERAASKIQAGFRGMKTRREIAELVRTKADDVPVVIEDDKAEVPPEDALPAEAEDDSNADQSADHVHLAATKIQAGFRGMKTRQELMVLKQVRAEPELSDADADARPEEDQDKVVEIVAAAVESEATVADASDEHKQDGDEEVKGQVASAENELTDDAVTEQPLTATAPTDDEDAISRAAERIQAGFRGMAARKQVRELKEQMRSDSPPNEGDVDAALDAEANDVSDADSQAAAASKILAGIEGMKARRESAEGKVDDEDKPDADAAVDEKAAEVDKDSSDQQVMSQEAAALKIQAAITGYKTRNSMDAVEAIDAEVTIDDPELDPTLDEPGNQETFRDSVDPEIARLTRESVEPDTARVGSADEQETARKSSNDLEAQDKPADEIAAGIVETSEVVEASETVPVDGDDVSVADDEEAGEEEELD